MPKPIKNFNFVVLLSAILISAGLIGVFIYKSMGKHDGTLMDRDGSQGHERSSVSEIALPQNRPESEWYTVIVHKASSIEIHAYDSIGRHTGPAPNPEPQSEWGFLEDRIPNSSISRFAGDWYLILHSSDTYLIKLQGKAEEYSTVDIILGASGDDSAPRFTYDIGKVTPSFSGSLTLLPGMTIPPALLIDSDGTKLKPNILTK